MPTEPTAMIATPHHLATDVGLQVLRDGGSAVDAAIAANAALTVLLPDQTSIGGDCFMQVWEPDRAAPEGFNGSGRAPVAASADQVRNAGFGAMPRWGAWTVTVPGTIDAWFAAYERHGTLPMGRLLAPASNLAREGFEISARLSTAIAAVAGDIARNSHAAAIFLDNGAAPAPGYRLVNAGLANAIDLIGAAGRDAFYTGAIADAIVAAAGPDAGGWMTTDDLARHAGFAVTPVATRYRDATIWELPPNSQGITAQLALAMMARETFGPVWDDPAWLHVQIEAKKRAFAIRDRDMGDPGSMTASVDDILAPATVDAIWADFVPSTATPGQATLPGDTVFLAVIDRSGLAVALIQSIYAGFGSGLVAGDTGIVLQNRGSYFSLVPGHPNELGGGKLPLHTLMPGMIDIPGRVRGPFGTQGGDAQAQIHMQLVSHLVDDAVSPEVAIARPRWFAGDARVDPYAVVVESGMAWPAIEGLQARGHQVTQVEPGWPHAGFAQMVLRDETTGALTGAADPRAEGSVGSI